MKYILSYNIKVRVRQLTGEGTVMQIMDDKGKITKGANEQKFISLFKMKKKIPIPDPRCIDLTNKGKKCCEAFADDQGNWSWIAVNGIKKFWHSTNTNQQVLLAEQIVKANTKGKPWQALLPIYVAVGSLIVLMAIFFILIGEPLKALGEYSRQTINPIVKMTEMQTEQLRILQEMDQNIQRVEAQVGSGTNSTQIPN
jgi:hypothetical protein